MKITAETRGKIDAILDNTTTPENGVPGVVYAAIGRNSNLLYENSFGVSSLLDKSSKIGPDTIVWIASITKVITAIAIMQLVERGQLSLDDPSNLFRYFPEMKDRDMIVESKPGKVKLAQSTKQMTLRHLLTHSAGFAYAYLDARVMNWVVLNKKNIKRNRDIEPEWLRQPLVSEPGDEWHYGNCTDFCGTLVERVTGMSLGQYFSQNIFQPLQMKNTYFGNERPRDRVRGSAIHLKTSKRGTTVSEKHQTPEIHNPKFQSGGGGLLGTANDCLKVLGCLLNGGIARNGRRILKTETVDLMFQGSLAPHATKLLDGGIIACVPNIALTTPLYPGVKKNWGLSFLITEEELPSGRGAGAAHWSGAANCYWTIDRKKGVATLMVCQLVPFGDPVILAAFHEAETELYEGLGMRRTQSPAICRL